VKTGRRGGWQVVEHKKRKNTNEGGMAGCGTQKKRKNTNDGEEGAARNGTGGVGVGNGGDEGGSEGWEVGGGRRGGA